MDLGRMDDGLGEYAALVARVDSFGQAVTGRRSTDLRCRAGCTGCCQVSLSVSEVEVARARQAVRALPPERRTELAARARGEQDGACVMLVDGTRCAIYEARPLVCRTQGHALRYPQGFIPVESILARAGDSDVTWCPLNYEEAPPAAEDVLDAERVDATLAVINRRYCESRGLDPLARRSLRELARERAL